MRATLNGCEVPQNRQPDRLALLRVKLSCEHIVPANSRDKWRWIVCFSCNQRSILGNYKIRVDEVNGIVLVYVAEKRTILANAQLVPAHVRNFEAWNVRKTDDFTGEEI